MNSISLTKMDYPNCAICRDDIMPVESIISHIPKNVKKIEHVFHKNCIEPWLKNHKTCALCMETANFYLNGRSVVIRQGDNNFLNYVIFMLIPQAVFQVIIYEDKTEWYLGFTFAVLNLCVAGRLFWMQDQFRYE
ncbi:MAG: RING finger domain-containing protein [Parachlamydiaceae bacterium]